MEFAEERAAAVHENQRNTKNNTTDHVIVVMDQRDDKLNDFPHIQSESRNNNSNEPADPTRMTTKTLRRLNFSKPKSRFNEVVKVNYPKSIPEHWDERESQRMDDESYSSSDDDDDDWYSQICIN